MKLGAVVSIALSLIQPASCLYSSKGDVKILTSKDFNSFIKNSDTVTIVEFFAPWCGHCKNLAPIYSKVATSLKGMVNVAAIDCDDESNKRTCGEYKVQGFPTIKMMLPKVDAKGRRSFTTADYNGERTAKAIANQATMIMPHSIERLTSATVDEFLATRNGTTKVLLFTSKGSISALYKALSINFRHKVSFGQVRDKETAAVEKFGVSKFPTLLLLPGGEAPAIVYEGELKRPQMEEFIAVNYQAPTVEEFTAEGEADEQSIKEEEPIVVNLDEEPQEKGRATEAKTVLTIENAEQFALHCLAKDAKPSLVFPESILGESDIDLVTPFKGHDVNVVKVASSVTGQFNSEALIYLNGKRGWYVAAKTAPTTRQEVLAFLDDVKQGTAGKKVKFEKEPAEGSEEQKKDEL